ncbi:hypothetical protein [Namhaeicola litoreus]|uniref:Outer membrane protein beta-barrel domain-containing protein n=1 Tax=Namhaeicola litoreus TaxID=1052145 RepID=A0ABW3XXN8_9FLAO
MNNKTIFTILFILTSFVTYSQKKVIPNNPNYQYQSGNDQNTQTTIIRQAPTFEPSWTFGGNFGFSFWNGGTDLLIAPRAYYHVSPRFWIGPGLIYNYSSYDTRNYDYSYNAFGGSLTGLYRPAPFVQLSAEFQELYTDRSFEYLNTKSDDSYWNSALYLGASFVSGHFAFGFQYDVLYDEGKSPYSSAWTPVISFYF